MMFRKAELTDQNCLYGQNQDFRPHEKSNKSQATNSQKIKPGKTNRLEKMENKISKTQVHDQTEFEEKPSKERKSPTGNNSIFPETRHFTKRIKIKD